MFKLVLKIPGDRQDNRPIVEWEDEGKQRGLRITIVAHVEHLLQRHSIFTITPLTKKGLPCSLASPSSLPVVVYSLMVGNGGSTLASTDGFWIMKEQPSIDISSYKIINISDDVHVVSPGDVIGRVVFPPGVAVGLAVE